MAFEISLPSRLDVCTLRCAGMETDAYHERYMDVIIKDSPVPFTVELPYFLSGDGVNISVTMIEKGKNVRLRIAAPEKSIERKIQQYMQRYSAENDGQAVADREHAALWKQIKAILAREGLTYEKVNRGEQKLNGRAIEGLIKLAAQVERQQRASICDIFANGHVERANQEFAVRWLIKQFIENPDPFERDQISLRIWENTVPKIADELIELLENRKFGSTRSALCMALAKTKHPRAADVIASVTQEDGMAWAALQGLRKLNAKQHVESVRKCLRHPDSDVKREAKKTLAKFGFPVETPPLPVHLVKKRSLLPKGLEEWSQNLDFDDLEPLLKKLVNCIDSGFKHTEIAEVTAVAENMKPDQTRAFCFPITFDRKPQELWLVIFMDDIDSPDLQVHACKGLIERFEKIASET